MDAFIRKWINLMNFDLQTQTQEPFFWWLPSNGYKPNNFLNFLILSFSITSSTIVSLAKAFFEIKFLIVYRISTGSIPHEQRLSFFAQLFSDNLFLFDHNTERLIFLEAVGPFMSLPNDFNNNFYHQMFRYFSISW